MNIKELKTLLKENNIPFYAYWGKKKLIGLANEHDLLPKPEPEKEKSKNVKYDRLKTIRNNPRTVMVEDIKTGEIKNLSIDLRSIKIFRYISLYNLLLGK